LVDNALEDIHRFLMIIIFNLVLIFQMVNVSGAVKVFVDIGFRANISFTKTVAKKEVQAVSMYEEPKRKNGDGVFGDAGVEVELLSNPNVMVTLEEEGSKRDSWEARETVMFTFDEENFA